MCWKIEPTSNPNQRESRGSWHSTPRPVYRSHIFWPLSSVYRLFVPLALPVVSFFRIRWIAKHSFYKLLVQFPMGKRFQQHLLINLLFLLLYRYGRGPNSCFVCRTILWQLILISSQWQRVRTKEEEQQWETGTYLVTPHFYTTLFSFYLHCVRDFPRSISSTHRMHSFFWVQLFSCCSLWVATTCNHPPHTPDLIHPFLSLSLCCFLRTWISIVWTL